MRSCESRGKSGCPGRWRRMPVWRSAMSPEEPHRLVLSYTRAMLSGLLFTRQGAAGGKYRTVPERYVLRGDIRGLDAGRRFVEAVEIAVRDGKLSITKTPNGENPLVHGATPIPKP